MINKIKNLGDEILKLLTKSVYGPGKVTAGEVDVITYRWELLNKIKIGKNINIEDIPKDPKEAYEYGRHFGWSEAEETYRRIKNES